MREDGAKRCKQKKKTVRGGVGVKARESLQYLFLKKSLFRYTRIYAILVYPMIGRF